MFCPPESTPPAAASGDACSLIIAIFAKGCGPVIVICDRASHARCRGVRHACPVVCKQRAVLRGEAVLHEEAADVGWNAARSPAILTGNVGMSERVACFSACFVRALQR